MAQEFHVVQCFKCQSFQVHQVKKVTRWSCKLCGEKQSLMKEIARGNGADCRRHVQKLNATRGNKMEEQNWALCHQLENDREEEPEEPEGQVTHTQVPQSVSRWSKYLGSPEREEPEEGDDSVIMDRDRLYGNKTDRPHPYRKRKRDGRSPQQPN